LTFEIRNVTITQTEACEVAIFLFNEEFQTKGSAKPQNEIQPNNFLGVTILE